VEQVQRSLARHFCHDGHRSQALLFGITPELALLPLPVDVELVAFDLSEPMIAAVWPGDTARRRARVGNWFALDLPEASVCIALGDGCLSTLAYPLDYRRFALSLARVLQPGGLFSLRAFCRPHRCERVDDVFADLLAARIGNFHVFKWRLAMALQGDDTAQGVQLARIWDTFQERAGGARELAARLGWPVEEVLTIDNYRASESVYTYSTVAELVAQMGAEFEIVEEWRGRYELAERCPQLLFRRR
jgi:SAM-dependent methyltransferase